MLQFKTKKERSKPKREVIMKSSLLRTVIVLSILSFVFVLNAQVTVSGRVIGNDAPNGLEGASVTLVSANNNYDTETAANGNFTINNVVGTAAGVDYVLTISLQGYQEHESNRNVRQQNVDVGTIRLDENAWAPGNLRLTESATRDTMYIEWDVPEPIAGTEQWMHYDSGQNATGVGTGQAAQMQAAIRFTPEQLAERDVVGLFVTSIKFFPTQQGATYTLRVWRGGRAAPFNPGQLATHQQVQNPTIGQWNEVPLNDPVQIPADQELWFGYHVNTPGGHPIGADGGPHTEGFGNILEIGGTWTTLTQVSNPPLTRNWNIQGFAGFTRGDRSISLNDELPDADDAVNHYEFDISNQALLYEVPINSDNSTYSFDENRVRRNPGRTIPSFNYRELEGYQVYRYNVLDEEEFEDWEYLGSTEDTLFVDDEWDDVAPGHYKFAVRAEYTNEVYSDFVVSRSYPQGLRFNLTGTVLASDTNEAVAGASVSFTGVEEYETGTGDDGSFQILDVLGDLEPTEYRLTITKAGYQAHISNHQVTRENVNLGNIILNEMAYAPYNVFAEINEDDDVDISWNSPFPATSQWLHWDDGENNDGIGANAAIQFQVAHRYTVDDLLEFDVIGLHITSVKFFPRHAAATYTVKVWRGGSANPFNPGQEAASQVAQNVVNEQWNEVVLQNPVRIEPNQELWVGYHINTQGGYPAGCDAGPEVHQRGNMMHWNNTWQTLRDVNQGLTYNWNIHAFAGYGRGERTRALGFAENRSEKPEASPLTLESSSNATFDLASNNNVYPSDNWRPGRKDDRLPPSGKTESRGLEGYLVYRLDIEDRDEPDDWTELGAVEDTTYTDTAWDDLGPGAYQYAVLAAYTNENYSIPVFSNVLVKDMHCLVTIRLTTNSDDPVTGAQVRLVNVNENPEHVYSEVAPENGVVVFHNVWRGTYNLNIRLQGFDTYNEDNMEVDDLVFVRNIQLIESLNQVTNLQYQVYNNNNVRLTWQEPAAVEGTEQWIHWDSGQNADAIGTGQASQFAVAARFTPANIEELDVGGLFINSVKFFPNVPNAAYTIKVWRGGSANPFNPGEELVSQVVREFVNSAWNEVNLSNPVEILPDQEIWFGYHVNTPTGHPAGCDAGPAVNGYGNLMYFNNEWTTLLGLSPDLNNNWNVQAYAAFPGRSETVEVSRNRLANSPRSDKNNSRALLGYKIMRDATVLAERHQQLIYQDTSLPIGQYVYSVIAQYTTGESEPVSTDQVVILSAEDGTEIAPIVTELRGNYPNPFNPDTKIAFSLANNERVQIDIFNLRGQKIKSLVDGEFESGNHTVIWNGKDDENVEVGSGIYFYRMKSGSYTTTKKMIMMK